MILVRDARLEHRRVIGGLLAREFEIGLADALERVIFGAFYQSGQSCISVQRILIHEAVYDALRDRLVAATRALRRGDQVSQMMQVTGEEGISIADYLKWQKSLLLDMVYLQQDAFDKVDASMSRERQAESFRFLRDLIDREYDFTDRAAARDFFTKITSLYRNWNYSAPGSPEYERYRSEITRLADQHRARPIGSLPQESPALEPPA